MKIYLHRSNSFKDLEKFKGLNIDGLECDVRYFKSLAYLDHDISKNIKNKVLLHKFANSINDKDIILNFKETGFEINEILNYKEIFKSLLILDCPFPVYVKAKRLNMGKYFMWRVSEYETPKIKTITSLGGEWIWLDSFQGYWFKESDLEKYKISGLKICLVSNELQNREITENYSKIKKLINLSLIDAICTKEPAFYNQIQRIN